MEFILNLLFAALCGAMVGLVFGTVFFVYSHRPAKDEFENNDSKSQSGILVDIMRDGKRRFVPFYDIKSGDFIAYLGVFAGDDAHQSGDASYDGWLFYDSNGLSVFPEDLDGDVRDDREDKWFGIVRWCNEDIACKMVCMGITPTKKSILEVRDFCEKNKSFNDTMCKAGWDMIETAIRECDKERKYGRF